MIARFMKHAEVTTTLSVYTHLTMLLGLVASRVVHPHLLSRDHLLIRQGNHTVVNVAVDRIVTAAEVTRYNPTVASENQGRLHLPAQDGTNVDLTLSTATVVTVPGLLKRQRRIVPVESISLFVDDPGEFIRALTADRHDPRGAAGDSSS